MPFLIWPDVIKNAFLAYRINIAELGANDDVKEIFARLQKGAPLTAAQARQLQRDLLLAGQVRDVLDLSVAGLARAAFRCALLLLA